MWWWSIMVQGRSWPNLGIAAAQNAGIAWARQHQADYVILFDHDSEPAPDMVARLTEAASSLRQSGHTIAAVGPRFCDERQDNPPPFIYVEGWRLRRRQCATAEAVVPSTYLISSGCLMPMQALDAVGGMDERLFIDYVDTEWGLRAGHMGLSCFGVCSAHMQHRLGDAPLRFMGRPVPLHSPLRHYYHMRNAVWLYRQPHIPAGWKRADGLRLLQKYIFYTLFAPQGLRHWRMMTLGIWHGLRGRLGPIAKKPQARP
jgi:rhamnosyltransferase